LIKNLKYVTYRKFVPASVLPELPSFEKNTVAFNKKDMESYRKEKKSKNLFSF